jgi:hypothetical protein
MIREAIDRVLELSDPDTIVVGDRTWRKGGYSEIEERICEPLYFHTLMAIADYAESEEAPADVMIHVASPTEVRVFGPLTREKKRNVYAVSGAMIDSHYPIRQWLSQDQFVTNVQTHFDDLGDRAALLKIAGTIRGGQTAVLEDDGVTQKVTTARGVVSTQMTEMPNPVTLVPWETFPEIPQPERKYIVRLQGGSEQAIKIALFDVPDPRQSLETCLAIKAWLVKALAPNLKESVLA